MISWTPPSLLNHAPGRTFTLANYRPGGDDEEMRALEVEYEAAAAADVEAAAGLAERAARERAKVHLNPFNPKPLQSVHGM